MSDESKRAEQNLGKALPALVLLLPVLFFARAVFTRDVFVAGDTLRAFYPMRAFWASRVSAFEWPEWFPYDGLGQSFIGIILSGVFHPTTLLHLMLPLGLAVKVTLLLSFILAMGGTWALLRQYDVPPVGALFSAVTFTFSGYLVCITNNPTYLLAASTVPATLWAAVRFLRVPTAGRLAQGGLMLALVAFAGDAQGFTMANALVVLVAGLDPNAGTWRRRVGTCALLIVTGGLLAAPQLLPAAGLAFTGEPGARSAVEAQRYSLHPLRLGEFLIGPFLADARVLRAIPNSVVLNLVPSGGFGRVWVDSIYVGLPACVLALAALATSIRRARTWVLLGAWLVLLALCLGDALPVYGWVYQVLPLWRPFRYPEKLVPLVSLGFAVAVGLGWKHCLGANAPPRAVVRVSLGLALLGTGWVLGEAVGGLWTQGWLIPHWPQVPPAVVKGLSDNVLRTGAVAVGLALACALLARVERLRAVRGGAFVALQFGALLWANEPFYLLSSPGLLETQPPFAKQILQGLPPGEPARVASSIRNQSTKPLRGYSFREQGYLTLLAGMLPDMTALWGIESVNGYLPGESVRVRRLKRDLPRWYGALAPRLGTAFSVHETRELAERPLPGDARALVEDPLHGMTLVAHPESLPHVYLAQARCVEGLEPALAALMTSELPPRDTAIVECPQPLPPSSPGPLGTVHVERRSLEHLSMKVDASTPGVLVVNDALQPGWTALLDGVETPILPANVAVRAVAIPAGHHQVEMRYRTPGLRLGLGLAAVTLLALGVAIGASRRARTLLPRAT